MPENIPHLPIGTIIGNGKYKIVRFIAAGGFGCTYEAEFLMMRTRVAIKEFFINSMCNREATGAISLGAVSQTSLVNKLEEKFLREAQNLFCLSHPNIVGVKDVFKEFGTSYYVMDYIDGSSLQSLIEQRGPMPEAQMMKYMSQVMDALEYVHSKKMLHLDLKPDNIMIDRNDRAILIDFGVSKQYDEADGHNTSTILGQTPGYAPIEQMGNNITNFAPSTDIYALGATMYAALTATAPPSAPDLLAGNESLSPLPPETSMQTRHTIELMMQTRSANRPQSISQVRQLLQLSFPNPLPQMPVNPCQQQLQPQQQMPPHNPYRQNPPLQPFNPYRAPAKRENPSANPARKSNAGLKAGKYIFMSFAILSTLVAAYYIISIFVYDANVYTYDGYYSYDYDFSDTLGTIWADYYNDYMSTCITYAILTLPIMIPCWILFGVFSKKIKRRANS